MTASIKDFYGPRQAAVSVGIPGIPSSDALRAQKFGGVRAPAKGRAYKYVGFVNRKSLQADNSNSHSRASSQAALAPVATSLLVTGAPIQECRADLPPASGEPSKTRPVLSSPVKFYDPWTIIPEVWP